MHIFFYKSLNTESVGLVMYMCNMYKYTVFVICTWSIIEARGYMWDVFFECMATDLMLLPSSVDSAGGHYVSAEGMDTSGM